MGTYVARRLLQMIPVFIGATLLVFFMVFAIPGDPIQAMAGERRLSEATLTAIQDRYNLNDPFLLQYLKYIGGVLTGDFGQAFNGREVAAIIRDAFPVTLRLAATAFAIELVIGITAGILAGLRRGSFIDNLVLVSTTAVISIPVFVLGYALQLVLGVEFGWFPIAGLRDGWISYVLPGFVLAATSLATSLACCGPRWSRTCAPTTSAPRPPRVCHGAASSAVAVCATRSSRSSPTSVSTSGR